jgi:hypothetical protein
MSKKNEGRLTDRERILMSVVQALSLSQSLAPVSRTRWGDEAFTGHDGYVYAHFATWRKPQAGDLVLARTGSMSEWKIAFYVEPLPSQLGGAVVREIGTDRLCNYENEEFVPIVGLPPTELLDGDKRRLYDKVIAAFRRGDEYMYLFGGIEFDRDDVVVSVRERWGGLNGKSKPFPVRFTWDPRMSIKAILAALRAGGYGAREFEREAE